MMEFLKYLIPFIGGVVFTTLIVIWVLADTLAKLAIIKSEILKFFGWAGKGVRKFSVEQEYQGTINSIIQDYNKNFENPILPNCKIEWVTAENQRNILRKGEAIICLSFDKKVV